MELPLDFFRDEVRCGFYIPTAIKQAWAAQLAILNEIDRICRAHDISWFADWGTLLGAVRHGGFVPWDDDLDISMRREDYIRFRAVADAELPPEYVIHDYERQEDHWLFLARVVNHSRICFEPEYLDTHHNYPWLAGVDIFLQDYLYRDEEKEEQRRKEILHLLALADGTVEGKYQPATLRSELSGIRQTYGLSIDPQASPRQIGIALYRLAEQQMARVPAEEADRMGQIFPWILRGGKGLPKEYYAETVRLPFESTTIRVPARYTQVLQSRYRTYLQIRKVWTGHGYPSFEGQRANLQAVADFRLPEFTFHPQMLERPAVTPPARGKREILFLPVGVREWRTLEPYYEEAIADPRNHVTVMPLPLIAKDALGQITGTDEEILTADHAEDYPEGLPLLRWYDYDPDEAQPDRVYLQNPYDNENPCLTVPPLFYAEHLRDCAQEVIYVPAFRTDEFGDEDYNDVYNLKYCATCPAAVYADQVIVQSENMRQNYIRKLTAFAGMDTEAIWEGKIKAAPADTRHSADNPAVRKKQILFCVGANEFYEHPDNPDNTDGAPEQRTLAEALKERLQIFADHADQIDLTLCLYPAEESLWPEIHALLTDYARSHDCPVCVYRTEDAEDLVRPFDAYYGSPSPFVPIFTQAGKPVMIMNVEITM